MIDKANKRHWGGPSIPGPFFLKPTNEVDHNRNHDNALPIQPLRLLETTIGHGGLFSG